jgi:hypothetical protein
MLEVLKSAAQVFTILFEADRRQFFFRKGEGAGINRDSIFSLFINQRAMTHV